MVVSKTLKTFQWPRALFGLYSLGLVSRYGLVCSVAPRKNFGALTTAPKFQRNGSAETSSATDGFFSSRAWYFCSDPALAYREQGAYKGGGT